MSRLYVRPFFFTISRLAFVEPVFVWESRYCVVGIHTLRVFWNTMQWIYLGLGVDDRVELFEQGIELQASRSSSNSLKELLGAAPPCSTVAAWMRQRKERVWRTWARCVFWQKKKTACSGGRVPGHSTPRVPESLGWLFFGCPKSQNVGSVYYE